MARIIKAPNPDAEDQASYCDDCGAEPGEPCEESCGCLPCHVGSVDRKEED
jgi:hypothetical protein